MADINVGTAAISRGEIPPGNVTIILKENPANADGVITLVKIYVESFALGFIVAIFEKVNGDTFTARSHQVLGDLEAGYQEIEVNLRIKEGDYIGYIANGWISQDAFGEGLWYLNGNETECESLEFTPFADVTLSLYGTGATLEFEVAVDVGIASSATRSLKLARESSVDVGIAPTADRRCVYHRYGWRP